MPKGYQNTILQEHKTYKYTNNKKYICIIKPIFIFEIQIGSFSWGHRIAPSCRFFKEKYLTDDNLIHRYLVIRKVIFWDDTSKEGESRNVIIIGNKCFLIIIYTIYIYI